MENEIPMTNDNAPRPAVSTPGRKFYASNGANRLVLRAKSRQDAAKRIVRWLVQDGKGPAELHLVTGVSECGFVDQEGDEDPDSTLYSTSSILRNLGHNDIAEGMDRFSRQATGTLRLILDMIGANPKRTTKEPKHPAGSRASLMRKAEKISKELKKIGRDIDRISGRQRKGGYGTGLQTA